MSIKQFETTAENYTMTADVRIIGSDLLIVVTGGDAPHIGTVTCVSKEDNNQTIRFHSHHGRYHKDDVLSEVIIKLIRKELPGNCVVIAGVHVNHITQRQIEVSSKMAKQLGEEINSWLQEKPILVEEVVYERYNHTY